MSVAEFITIACTTALALAAVRFVLLPALVRLAWRAPRVRERDTPARLGLPFEAVGIPTRGAKRLYGWLVPQAGTAPALVLMHGWGGNAENLLPLAEILHRAGWTVLLVDARNHGLSDSDGFSSMVKFAEDVDESLDWLKARPEVDAQHVALVGHSVGAAAVLLAASRRRDLAAVVSLAAFAHPREIMRAMLTANRIPYVPLGWWILRYIEQTIGARYDAIAPVSTIRRVACPVLLVHGTGDERVPVADAYAIHQARGDAGAQLLILADTGHRLTSMRRHAATLVDFLNRAFGSGGLVPHDARPQASVGIARECDSERRSDQQQT